MDGDVQGEARTGLYRRFFAWMVARLEPEDCARTVEAKRRLIGDSRGLLVEIGPGAGANLQYLPPDVRYVGVEPNVHMHGWLREEAERLGRQVEVRTGTAERLPFEDATVDTVLSTLVLCSVDDPARVFAEIRRVLRPGGRFVFVEHVAAGAGSRLLRWQRRVQPFWRKLGDGCEPDRPIGEWVKAAGFARVELQEYRADLPIPLVRPHVAGVAFEGE